MTLLMNQGNLTDDAEAQFRALADCSPVVVWVTDPSGRCTYLNRRWYELTGQTPGAAENFGWLDAAHPDDRTRIEGTFRAANADRAPFRLEYRLRAADGSYRSVIDIASPRLDAHGEFLGYVGSVIDIEDRREAEQRLSLSEERLRLASDAGDVGLWDVDVVADELFWPARVKRMFGISADVPVTMQDFYDGLHPDDRARTVEAYAAACDPERRAPYDVEYRTVGKEDGVVRTVAAKGKAIFDEDGRCVRVLGTAVDTSASRQAQAALRDSEARYRALFEAIDTGFCVVEVDLNAGGQIDYRVVEANRAFFSQTGFPEAIVGEWLRQAAPTLEEYWFETYGEVAATGVPRRFEQGSPTLGRWFDVYAFPTGELGSGRVAILFNDISARHDAEMRLRANLQQMPGFVAVLTGPSHVYEYVNDAYVTISGQRDFIGRGVRDVFPELADQGFYELLDQVYSTGEPFAASAMPIHLAGEATPRFIDFLYEPIRKDGVVSGIFVGGYDISERVRADHALQDLNVRLEQTVADRTADLTAALQALKTEGAERERAEEALRQSQKLEGMGQLTGGVAHDFNNLLTPIIGSLDLLQRRGLGGEREQKLIAGAIQSAERAKTLVQRLLAFARRQPLQAAPIDLGALMASMGDLIASTTGPQIKVTVEVPSNLPPAHADPNQVEMALLNLAVNGRDAMPDGGTLRISARAETVGSEHHAGLQAGDYLCLSVADTGVGMDSETLQRAIEPFFSTKGIGKGTGLGLSMVHGLASQLGGGLTLHSHPGVGTNVELWLPVSRAALPADEAAAASEPPLPGGVALVVDDEPLVRMTTADMLGELGYKVVEADSATEALSKMRGGLRPDLVVTDHLMPGMTGTELAIALRETDPRLKVLIVSGYAETEGLALDIARLTKPFRSEDLAARPPCQAGSEVASVQRAAGLRWPTSHAVGVQLFAARRRSPNAESPRQSKARAERKFLHLYNDLRLSCRRLAVLHTME